MVSHLSVYPVKSLGGVTADEAVVEPWGLRHDRRFVALDPDGTRVTARELHDLLAITATPLDEGAIVLTARDGSSIEARSSASADELPTSLSRVGFVRSTGPEADAWLSETTGRELRLGWLDDPRRRSVAESHGGLPGETLSAADAGPLLLTTTSSLARLNEWIGAADAVPMERFRPNVVVDDDLEPFAEDEWKRVTIGEVDFRVSERCDRCVMTTIDTQTLAGGKEPLRTMARHRQWDHKTWFGIRLVPLSAGTVRVGDAVSVPA